MARDTRRRRLGWAVWGWLLLALSAAPLASAAERGVVLVQQAQGEQAKSATARTALVIGNGSYRRAPLRNPVNDATDMAEALQGLGFEVVLAVDVNEPVLVEAMRKFRQRLQRRGGVGLFYYAGHGIQVRGRNYLIPVGADIETETDVEYEGVDAGRVLSYMEEAEARLNIVILDACRDSPYERSWRSASRGLKRLELPRGPLGSLLAYSTAPGEVAADGTDRNSPFTKHLLLNLGIAGLDVEDVFKRTRIGVSKDTGGRQIPWSESSLLGDFYFRSSIPGRTEAPTDPGINTDTKRVRPRVGDTWTEPVTKMQFVWVPSGCFQMGSEEGAAGEKPMHQVCLKGFWLGKHEVMQGQWRRVMGSNPAGFKKDDKHPVEDVSWEHVQEFVRRLNKKGKERLRLPSEAKWEYACRSGGRVETYCGGEDVDSLAWYRWNSGGTTHPVGRKQANGLDLHDMSGNVAEWVQDCWYDNHNGAPGDGAARDVSTCSRRVHRGGAWDLEPATLRSTARHPDNAHAHFRSVGFRLMRTP